MKNIAKINCVNLKEEDKYSSGIYKIYHELFPTKLYIGSTVRGSNSSGFIRRWGRHYSELLKNKHCNKKLQRFVNKYGISSLKFEIVEIVQDNNNVIKREQHWMDLLNPYYNICKKAGSTLGVKTSVENVIRMSRSIEQFDLFGKTVTTFINVQDAFRKTEVNASIIRQACEKQFKGKCSQAGGYQWKFKDSVFPVSVYKKETSCQLNCYTKEGKFYKTFSSILEASRELNIPTGNISHHLTDKRSGTCYGYVFKKVNGSKVANKIAVKNHHKKQYKVLIYDTFTNDSLEYVSFNKVATSIVSKCTLSKMIRDNKFEKLHKKRYKIHIMPYE